MARTVQQYFSWIGAAKGVSFSGGEEKILGRGLFVVRVNNLRGQKVSRSSVWLGRNCTILYSLNKHTTTELQQ
jgi:hypothetical protein